MSTPVNSLMDDMWRKVPGYPDYSVCADGRVRRDVRSRAWRSAKVLKNSRDRNGYAVVNLFRDKKPTKLYVHRLVALAFIPNPKSLSQVAHVNGDPLDARAENLRWSDQSMNELDKRAHGTAKTRSPYAEKLDKAAREQIKVLAAKGQSQRMIASQYNVSHSTVCALLNGKSYRWCDG